MTVLAEHLVKLDARPQTRTASFRVELVRDWKQAAARWNDINPPTPFQHRQWCAAWYDAFAGADGVEPLIAVITDAASGEQAALLPLIRRRHKGMRIVEFADLDLTDYNAPILGNAAPRDARAARALWRDLRAALRKMPGGADLIRLRKVPADLGGRPNPLALLADAGPCAANGNVVTTGDDYDGWR